jgi:glc operon protein GlcG
MHHIDLSSAERMLHLAQDAARAKGQRISIAIVDAGGHLVVFRRMDGVPYGAIDMAQVKARTAVMFGCATKDLPGFSPMAVPFAAANSQPVAMIGGGMVIRAGESIVGGIGIGGAADPADDHAIAVAALS